MPTPKLYLDENFGQTFARILASRSFDVLTAQEANMLGRSDEEQLTFAASRERCLVSQNVAHFVVLHGKLARRGTDHAGILVVQHDPNAAVMASKCIRRLANETDQTLKSRLLYA